VGVALHGTTVHKGTRVTLVSITDYILYRTRRFAAELPLQAGGEASTTTTSQTGAFYLINYLLRGHLKQHVAQGLVTTYGNVVFYPLRVDVTAITKDNTLLLLIEVYIPIIRYCLTVNGVLIKKMCYWLSITKVRLDNLWDIINANVSIKDTFRFNDNNGTLLAEAVAASEIHLHPFYPQLSHHFL
jgi:hypothetical protein